MLEQFEAENAPITQVYYCPHHPDAGIGSYRIACECRKPEPGMLLKAAAEHAVDLAASVMVGDSLTDMQAAKRAGVERRFLIGEERQISSHDDHTGIVGLNEVATSLHWR